MEKFKAGCEKLMEIINYISCIAIVVMMAVVVVDVAMRFFDGFVKGQVEIVSYCMVVIVWFALGRVAIKKEMIQVNIFNVGVVVEVINLLISLVVCGPCRRFATYACINFDDSGCPDLIKGTADAAAIAENQESLKDIIEENAVSDKKEEEVMTK